MASAAIDLLIGKIASILENEVYLLKGIRDEVEGLKEELVMMRSFLEDSDKRQSKTQLENTWVSNVRDIAYDVEDIIDEFTYYVNKERSGGHFSKFLFNTLRLPKGLWVRHKIAIKLQIIKMSIKDIPERSQRYALIADRSSGSSSTNDDNNRKLRRGVSSIYAIENDLVGIENNMDLLMGHLMDDTEERTVTSIVGMGGSGKTTLAAKIYNNEEVKRCFDSYSWIYVSQKYNIDDLFRNLIKEFHLSRKEEVPSDLNAMDHKDLVEKLVHYLQSKRYMVVLDDVWNEDFWDEIRVGLPDYQNRSRILVTTRNAELPFGSTKRILDVRPLEESESWELFCMKAFFNNPNKRCPQELEPLARELVDKCEGLPLAIVALGGLMSSKKHKSEWSKVCNSLNWHLKNSVRGVLQLSFENLPYRLKNCFLYCSVFPEDYLIKRKRLIRLWISEGFVEHVKGISLEEVADGYFMELIFRSMLQVVERNESGRPKICKMHDLMRETALSTSESEHFCSVHDGKEALKVRKERRVSVQLQTIDEEAEKMKAFMGMSKLRSFFMFVPRKSSSSAISFIKTVCSEFKLLKVLDLEGVPIDKLPDDVVKRLFNLRYLNLRRTLITELPNSIGKLRNLQTLDIRDSKIEVLPSGIAELQNLQYLINVHFNYGVVNILRYVFGTKVPPTISKLKNLKVLSLVEAEGDIIRQLGSMTQLRKIGIANVKETDEKHLCESIEKMIHLQFLHVMVTDERESLRMDALKSPPPSLTILGLVGKLEKVPEWLTSLRSLTRLILQWSRLSEDPLPYIATLPCLNHLELANAYDGKKLCFRNGFSMLRRLSVGNFTELDEIIIEKGVMPEMSILTMYSLKEMKRVPEGIEFLSKLGTLFLRSVSMELIDRIRYEGSVDRQKVQHIPNIHHTFETSSGKLYFERLNTVLPRRRNDPMS